VAHRDHPALASVTIRRLVLPERQAEPTLGAAIAAALARELGGGAAGAAKETGVAQAIARGIAGHPRFASAVSREASHDHR